MGELGEKIGWHLITVKLYTLSTMPVFKYKLFIVVVCDNATLHNVSI